MNKLEEDFSSKEEYNDYLEEIEVIGKLHIVSSLVRGERVEEYQTKLQKYAVDFQDQIEINRAKQEECLRQLKRKAIIEDAVFNENLRNPEAGDQAQEILDEEAELMDLESVVVKEMPEAQNIESVGPKQNYSLEEMEADFRKFYLKSSGFNVEAQWERAYQELCASADLALL